MCVLRSWDTALLHQGYSTGLINAMEDDGRLKNKQTNKKNLERGKVFLEV